MPTVVIGGMDFPILYRAVPMTLTLDLLGSSPDFRIPSGPNAGQLVNGHTFNVVQPVPEPTSMLLLARGLGMLYARRLRNQKRREFSARIHGLDGWGSSLPFSPSLLLLSCLCI